MVYICRCLHLVTWITIMRILYLLQQEWVNVLLNVRFSKLTTQFRTRIWYLNYISTLVFSHMIGLLTTNNHMVGRYISRGDVINVLWFTELWIHGHGLIRHISWSTWLEKAIQPLGWQLINVFDSYNSTYCHWNRRILSFEQHHIWRLVVSWILYIVLRRLYCVLIIY